jgi:hypothetical protein
MKQEKEKAIISFNKLITENSTKTELKFKDNGMELEHLFQAEELKGILDNNKLYFEGLTCITFELTSSISDDSVLGLALLFNAAKNVTSLDLGFILENLSPSEINHLKLPKLNILDLQASEDEGIECFLSNHQNLIILNAGVFLTSKTFSYMKKVEKLDLRGGGLDPETMVLLGDELRKRVENSSDALLPLLSSLDLTNLMGMNEDEEFRSTYNNTLLPAIQAYNNVIAINYDMVASENQNEVDLAIKKLSPFSTSPLNLSELSQPVKTFLSKLQNSPYWKNEELFEKYIASTFIKMLNELTVDSNGEGKKTTQKSMILTDINESIKGCATNITGTILSYYAAEKCNNYIETIYDENNSISKEETMNLLIGNHELITNITPIILTEYLNTKINEKCISGDRNELIAAALDILAGKKFSRKDQQCAVSNPIKYPRSISNYKFTLSDLQLNKIFDSLLVFNENVTITNKLKELISTYCEQFFILNNKTTWAKNLTNSCQTNEDLRSIMSDLHDNEELNSLINYILKGRVINVEATNEAEYVTNVTKHLKKLVNNDKKEDLLLSKKQYSETPKEKDDYYVNDKKNSGFDYLEKKIKEYNIFSKPNDDEDNLYSLNYKNVNKQHLGTEGQTPTLKEIKRKINKTNIAAIAFEPTDTILGNVMDSIPQDISNHIRVFLNKNPTTDNFICHLPDNYTLNANGGHFICILREKNTFIIFDPLNEKNSQTDFVLLINEIKVNLGYECINGNQDALDVDKCGDICMKYINGNRKSK